MVSMHKLNLSILTRLKGRKADLIVTVKELAEQFDDKNVAIVRSYINKKKITEDVLEALKQAAQ